MPFTKWWHSLAISFSVVTWGLAQPLFDIAAQLVAHQGGTARAVLLLVLIWQILPTAALFAIERIIISKSKNPAILRVYRIALFSVATIIFLRAFQIQYVPQVAMLSSALKVLILILPLFVVPLIVTYLLRPVSMFFAVLSVASLVATGIFANQAGLFNTAWNSLETNAIPQTTTSDNARPPVFIIVFDAFGGQVLLKDGGIDPERFPKLASLGKDSAVFTNATSNYGLTSLSLAEMMTGQKNAFPQPAADDEPVIADSTSVFSVLTRSGYTVNSYDDLYVDCPPESVICRNQRALAREHPFLLSASAPAILFGNLFPHSLQMRFFSVPLIGHLSSRMVWNEFLSDINAPTAFNQVFYVHLLLPHMPYEFDPQGRWHLPPPAGDPARMASAYEQQVMFVDTLVGELTEKLKAEGLYEQSVIIITGDHGPRNLGALLSHPPTEMNPIIPNVALVIHGPGVNPQVSDADYQHIDFKPTLLDILGLASRNSSKGVSAFARQRPTRQKLFWYNWLFVYPGRWYAYDAVSRKWLPAPEAITNGSR